MIIDWRDVLLHYMVYLSGCASGALVGIYVYRSAVGRWDAFRRRWL
jgi:hypothetical protein